MSPSPPPPPVLKPAAVCLPFAADTKAPRRTVAPTSAQPAVRQPRRYSRPHAATTVLKALSATRSTAPSSLGRRRLRPPLALFAASATSAGGSRRPAVRPPPATRRVLPLPSPASDHARALPHPALRVHRCAVRRPPSAVRRPPSRPPFAANVSAPNTHTVKMAEQRQTPAETPIQYRQNRAESGRNRQNSGRNTVKRGRMG